jgi:hypothetical protein
MTIRTPIITAAIVLAFAAPAVAGAAHGNRGKGVEVGISTRGTLTTPSRNSGHTTGAKLISPKPVTSNVIYIEVPAVTLPAVESQQELCQTQGAGCTDQQYCAFWNIACDSGGASDPTGGSSTDPAELLSQLENEYCCDPLSCMSFA